MNAEITTTINSEPNDQDEFENASQSGVNVSNTDTSVQNPYDVLSKLNAALLEPIPKNPSVQYISETAHKLVDGMNTKRKNDHELLEQFRSALDNQVSKNVQALEEHLYQMYEKQNAKVDQKLEELFSCLDSIKASETEIENFRESLKHLYQEMHNI